MKYIQYFDEIENVLYNSTKIIVDGRYRISRCHEEAREKNNEAFPKYDAYQIFEGGSLNNAKPVTDIFKLKGYHNGIN